MNVTELFQNLSLGELSNTALGNDGSGTIPTGNLPKLVRYTNAGLFRLYSRYVLLEKTVLIEQQEAKTRYVLNSNFALSKYVAGPDVPTPYIVDVGESFTDDVIKIMDVFDSFGRKLAVNDEENCDSVFTPQPNVLQVPRPVPCALLGVKYQAQHPKITLINLDDDLLLPNILEDALTAFIAWQVYANMNTQEASVNAQEHQANFESICGEVIANDLVNSSISTTNTKFRKRGWR